MHPIVDIVVDINVDIVVLNDDVDVILGLRGAVDGAVEFVLDEAEGVDIHVLGDKLGGGQRPALARGVGEAVERGGDVTVDAVVEDERAVARAARVEAQLDPLADEATRLAESLRTPTLRPPRYPDDWMYGALDCEDVAELIDRRRSLIADLTPTSDPGRILCVIGDLDTAMGEGTVESNGIIDDAYLPPWDTWFACIHAGNHTLLLAWIPAPLVDAVQAAIDVAATDPIAWVVGPHPLDSAWQAVRDLLADAHRALGG